MKKVSLLLSLISLILCFSAQGQIVTKYQQGFESSGETYSYHATQGGSFVTTVSSLYSSGNSCLKLCHSSQEVIVELDTIDFTDNGQLNAFYLEFSHICDVNPLSCQSASDVATVEVKRPGEAYWNVLGDQDYDHSWGGGSEEFSTNPSFSERSYDLWMGLSPTNSWWKHERFTIYNYVTGSLADRKLQIRFRLKPRTASGASNEGWYLDNITVKCSPNSMVLPVTNMIAYPDMMEYPNSRGTKIMAEFTTIAVQGMCQDSIYLLYRLGTNAPIVRSNMTAVPGYTNRFVGYIPFCGFDTVVNWRMIAKDNTPNHNQTNYPQDENSWGQYKCVRGRQTINQLSESTASTNDFPFANYADTRVQMVFNKYDLANAGYKPGAITQIRYMAASSVNNSNHERFVIKMCNVPDYFVMPSDNKFYTEFQKVVYDSSLSLTQNNGTYGTIYLQDTFFYAGHDIMVTMYCDNVLNDPAALSVRCFNPSVSSGGTLNTFCNGYVGYSSLNNPYFKFGTLNQKLPNFIFVSNAHAPLVHDCGISGFIHPNDTTPAVAGTNNNVVVTLKNYGAADMNGVRIYYSVDNGAHQYFDWTGTLVAGATTNVTINTTQTYTPGYHEMIAWVDDSILVSGVRYRDHEPYNDTLWTRFIACDGAMSGTRHVGGSTPDYSTLEQFLYAVSQCGVNGPLTVKLAPGTYRPVVFPTIPGTSVSNYILFEPEGNGNTVTFEADNVSNNGLTANSLINLQSANHIRFNRINFLSSVYVSNAATYQVRLGINSTGCQFTNCNFSEGAGSAATPADYMIATALLYSGGCDSLRVENCSFSRGKAGISLIGPASDNMARGSSIIGNSFTHQGINGVIIRNQIGATVDSNVFDDVYANSSYVILLQDCGGASRITRNTVYVTSGASCIGATGFSGSSTAYAVVANNMLVSADDGTSNMLTTPLNIINADYTKVVFNSIKMTAPTRSGIAAATFGGSGIDHSQFYNNIVSCFDTVNFAFNYIPTQGSTNYIGYNIYYSKSPVLNKYDGINCLNFTSWLSHCSDGSSQVVDPAFLNSTNTDLRSYSQSVKNHGVPIAEVTNDLFGTPRDLTTPCVGAFEFAALPYDFEVIEYIEPYDEYCQAPSNAPIKVVIKNSGVNAFDPSTAGTNVQLTYSRTNVPGQMVPTYSGNVLVNRVIPATDTIIFNTGITMPFLPNGLLDTTYHLYTWLTSTIDPNPANDTSFTLVTAHYHAPAPDSIAMSINYGTAATVNATGGLQNWYSNIFTSSTLHKSEVYWYTSPTSTTPIWRGNTFVTDPLYTDTSFYIRQKRDFPLVKITEVQFKNNMPGVTYPMPLWMNSQTTFAIELTNVGDYPADMTDDTIMLVSNTSSLNNKIYKFPHVVIQPGASLVLQYRGGINADSVHTLGTANLTANLNANLGVLYYSNGVIEDAVAFNLVTTQNQWTSKNVPNNVWAGSGIVMPDSTAGVYRKGWPTGNSLSNAQQYWQIADNNNKMTLGTTNTNLIRYTDNGCLGDVAPVRIHLISLPDVDMAIDSLDLASGCGLGIDSLSVVIHNRGSQASGTVIAHYDIVASPATGQALAYQSCIDTLPSMPSMTMVNHTFSVPVNFTVNYGNLDFTLRVWVEKISADNTNFNDTVSQVILSSFTPSLPNVYSYDTVNYGEQAVLQAMTPPADSLAWYDRDMQPLDTVNVFTSNYLYVDDTFYVSAFGPAENPIHVGTLASTNSASGYPSPYNPNKKFVREQYLFPAEDLIAAGHGAGPINSISFYLDTILAAAGQITFTDYEVSLGVTSDLTFASNTAWHDVTPYYSANTLTVSNSAKGWIKHTFDSTFVWDGTSNIVVQIIRTVNPNITQGAKTRYTAAGSNKVLYKNDNNNISNLNNSGSRSANRPDVRFGFVDFGCEGPAKPVYVTVIGTPATDAAIDWPESYDTVNFSSCGNIDVDVTVTNMGLSSISGYTINYWIDGVQGVYNGTTPIASRNSATLTIAQPALSPGRHHIRAIVNIAGDTVPTNDTISRVFNVRFCAGTYTIGTGGLFANFTTAIDTLVNAGIDGPIVFSVYGGTYNEQLTIGQVDGTSSTNTITFRGATGDSSDVVLRFAPVTTANYVLNLDGAEYMRFENMTFYSAGAQTFSNVINLANSNNIHFSHDLVRVKGTINNANANCFVVGENVRYLYIDTCCIDSGYYAIRSIVNTPGLSEGMYINSNDIVNFQYQGIYLRKVNDVYVMRNRIHTGVNINNRSLVGVFIAEHEGPVTIERNNVVLSDNRSGGKQGIKLVNVSASNATRSHVYNNMAAISGTGNSGLTCAGIYIDSSSWINVYFNTCQIYLGTSNQGLTTRAFSVESTSSDLYVMNNIFSNISRGYALYAKQAANITTSNYNDYWTNSDTRFAYWSTECVDFASLRAANSQDVNSQNIRPYFISTDDLHLSLGDLCEKAQYNTEVPNDIDGTIRPQIPNPCIGAHEFERANHNVAVKDILTPELGVTDNIESDTLWVKVLLTNDGMSTEYNLSWWAEIDGTSPLISSVHRSIPEIQPQQDIYDSVPISMPIGIIDTQYVTVHFPLTGDIVPENNDMTVPFFLDPAYNLRAQTVAAESGDGCRLQNTQISVTLTNVGRKTFTAGTTVQIGYQAILQTSGVTVSTLPLQHVENAILPVDVEPNASVTLNYVQPANLYPTGIAKDIVVRVRAWNTYQYDQKPANDTTTYINVNSKFTPSAPVGIDLHIPYATWDTIFASQTDNPPTGAAIHRPIRWHRDSTAEPYYASNNYNLSCRWETPQYFHDSVYYLSCISSSGCTSYYNPVHVYLNPRVPVDMALLSVEEPLPQMVYMVGDTVKVALINYGSQSITNIPVVYQLYSPTHQLLQEVQETCHATVPPDSIYVFSFDSLITVPSWYNPTQSNNKYYIKTWTDMPNENVRLNDTLRVPHQFVAATDVAYATPQVDVKLGLDITRVAYSSLDNVVSPVGYSYLNFVNATNELSTNNVAGAVSSPSEISGGVQDFGGNVSMQNIGDLRALHLIKGTTDTMIIECANTDRASDNTTEGWVCVYIDQNRDGYFDFNPQMGFYGMDYGYPYTEIVYHDSIRSNTPLKFNLTIPNTIHTGYTRMRVVLGQGFHRPFPADTVLSNGCAHDYLIYIEEEPVSVDACAARIVAPRSQFIGGHTGIGDEDSVVVSFMMANKGASAINAASVTYAFMNKRDTVIGNMQWTGDLDAGHSVEIVLPQHQFQVGVTDFMVAISVPGDENQINDTLLYQYYRAPVIQLYYDERFEACDTEWFAPRGYTAYSRNLWERGYPQKVNIMSCVSDSNVWATNLSGYINTFQTGNLSYLYTPIINITQIRPDTITLWVATDMAEGHLMYMEFCDYLGRWTVMGDGNDTLWYNSGDGWTDVTSGYGYTEFRFPTSRVSGDFQQRVQFRFAYKAVSESDACDGAAFDNVYFGRQRRGVDAGVVAIIYPTEPRFGQVINPKVVIYNYGYDTLHTITLAYMPYGSPLATIGTYESEEGLAPNTSTVYTFPTPFTVMNDFPDTFSICAYTRMNMDLYKDNDTTCGLFYLSPLDNDMGMVGFVSPLEHVIAGDSVLVTTRLRNYGQAPVQSATVTYIYNNIYTVTENINFQDLLGRELQSFEYFNYSFHDRFRASMGSIDLKAYVEMANDDYLFNDTITTRINGISAITDLRAREVLVDTSHFDYNQIVLVVDNVGARAANDFELGFWYYNDTNTLVRATYHSEVPLPALATLCYTFDTHLVQHSQYYRYVTAYVHALDDNDRSNDTTTVIGNQVIDLRAVRVIVEENREDSCKVYLEIENVGNRNSTRSLDFEATVNGTRVRVNSFSREIAPGERYKLAFTKKIPKSPTRTYEGYGTITNSDDRNASNNSTSVVEVVNYVDGIPLVTTNGMVLQQNYPNPFDNATRIEFTLPYSGKVKFFVMDELGRLVYQKVDVYSSGDHSIDFNDSSLNTGVYYYGIEMDGERLMRKMILKR
ncbi:MAG: T9SS type A sorting domain-containing protein [Bacteroidales bacterium]|nr:T9SS type A sorting domain-containing protein [Bacteroidales bacterium]